MKLNQTREFYDFASFRLDVKKRRLTRVGDDEIVPLTPKEFEVLFLLVENQPRTIEKDELLEAIWTDTFVEESTLTRNVSWLRKKLAAHDADSKTKFIETVPKRGYRFLPEVVKTVEHLPFFINGGAIVLEEEIIQQIQIEETLEISPSQFDSAFSEDIFKSNGRALPDSNVKALPAAFARLSVSPVWILPALFIFAALAFFAFRNSTAEQKPKITLAARVVPFSGLPGREESPSFSPDGKQMVFSWNGGNENAKLNVYVKLIGAGEPVRLTTQETDDINPVFSPDEKSIAFVRVFPTHNEIVLMPALGGAERKILDRASYASLSFSPDGKLLAHAELDAANNKAGIFTINLETGERAQITAPDAPTVDHTPRFSPDGKFIAFDAQAAGGSDIYIVSVEGGAARRLTEDAGNNSLPAWSADGEWVFFNSNRAGDEQIWKMRADGGDALQITKQGAFEMFAAPDGKTIVYSKGNGKMGLWSISVDGADEKPFAELEDAGAWRSWTVAGNGLYYTAFAAQIPLHIKFYDFAAGKTKEIATVDKLPLAYYANLAVSLGGAKILYARQDRTAAAIMVAESGE